MRYGVPLSKLSPLCAVDTETTGLNSWTGDRPFMVTFCDEYGKEAAYYWEVDPFTREPKYDQIEIDELRRFFKKQTRTAVMWNAPFDMTMLESAGIPFLQNFEEGMFAMHCVNTLEPSIGLKQCGDKYLGFDKEDQKDLKDAVKKARREAKKKGWKIAKDLEADYWLAMNLCLKYGLNDAKRTMLLWLTLQEWMTEEEVWDSYNKEKKLLPIVLRMQNRGVRIDPKTVKREIKNNAVQEIVWFKRLQEMAPQIDNFNSDAQLRKFIFGSKKEGGLALKPGKLTATGLASVSAKALKDIDHPFLNALFKYRAASDANQNFFRKYRDLAVKDPDLDYWVLHPSFHQVGPVTGRFACRQPNLQNVPNALTTRSREPIQARTPFGPRPGYAWLAADYKQLEVRIFADRSKEDTLLNAILSGRDMHTECANKAWGGLAHINPAALKAAVHSLELDGTSTSGESRELVLETWDRIGYNPKLKTVEAGRMPQGDLRSPEEAAAARWLEAFEGNIVAAEASLHKENSRAKAKMLLFLKVFGGGAKAAADLMGCTFEQARDFLKEYDTAFPRIQEYSKELSKQALKNGFIRDAFGRKLRVPADKAYVCVNYIVQGSAASFIKDRMIAVEEYLEYARSRGADIWQVLTVHDEIIFEIKKMQGRGIPMRHARAISEIMQDHGGHFDVALPLDLEYTEGSWNNKEKIKLAV